MKCLLSSSKFNDQQELLNHYVNFHHVDENNWFFQKLFQIKDTSVLKSCLRCDEFILNDKHRRIHNFLKHYDDGKTQPFEEKLLAVKRISALTIYSIEFNKHKNSYNFYNSEACVDDFLRNVKCRFKVGNTKWFKCSFSIENIQSSIYPGLQPILNTRYWTTPVYSSVYFNDFIIFGLKQDFLNRVIINGSSGSSWHFKRFIYLAVKILNDNIEAALRKMTDFTDFEADVEGKVDHEDMVSNNSDSDSLKSFIDNEEVNTDLNVYRHFYNVQTNIDEILAEKYDEALRDIEKFDEISNLCYSSEDEIEIDNFKRFEETVNIFHENLFPQTNNEREKERNQLVRAILYEIRFDKTNKKYLC